MLWEDNNPRGLNARYIEKIDRILDNLNDASGPEDLRIPQYRLHKLVGDLADYWSLTVSANWRIIFRFQGQDVTDVDLIDYH